MNNKKIKEQFIQHHRMLKIRDFVTNFVALSLFVFGLFILYVTLSP